MPRGESVVSRAHPPPFPVHALHFGVEDWIGSSALPHHVTPHQTDYIYSSLDAFNGNKSYTLKKILKTQLAEIKPTFSAFSWCQFDQFNSVHLGAAAHVHQNTFFNPRAGSSLAYSDVHKHPHFPQGYADPQKAENSQTTKETGSALYSKACIAKIAAPEGTIRLAQGQQGHKQ